MIRAIAFFTFMWLVVAAGLYFVQRLTRQEVWKITKILLFSAACTIVTVIILIGTIFMF